MAENLETRAAVEKMFLQYENNIKESIKECDKSMNKTIGLMKVKIGDFEEFNKLLSTPADQFDDDGNIIEKKENNDSTPDKTAEQKAQENLDNLNVPNFEGAIDKSKEFFDKLKSIKSADPEVGYDISLLTKKDKSVLLVLFKSKFECDKAAYGIQQSGSEGKSIPIITNGEISVSVNKFIRDLLANIETT
jgi:hypothetical protein